MASQRNLDSLPTQMSSKKPSRASMERKVWKRSGRFRSSPSWPRQVRTDWRKGYFLRKFDISELPELGCSVAHLALAWIARNPNTSTVILGASKPEQVVENLKALDVIPKLTPEILDKIEEILKNKPSPIVCLFYEVRLAKPTNHILLLSPPLGVRPWTSLAISRQELFWI